MAQKIIFKEKDEKTFWDYWREFVSKNNVSPRYLPSYLEWKLKIANERVPFAADKSFVYLVNNKVIACVLFPLERNNKNIVASLDGDYIFAPLVADSSSRKEVFALIDKIAQDNKVVKIMFSEDIFELKNRYNYLQRYNYLDTSILSFVIDLETPDLLAACRKGHRQSIEKIINDKNFNSFYIDSANPSYDLYKEYVKLHHKASGRVTRSLETFDMQFDRLKKGRAVLFGLKYKDKNVAFAYFDFNVGKATYSSGADDPDYNKFFLYHALLYKAMEYFKNMGVKYIDTNQPSSPSAQFDYYPDKKQLNIAFFKRGFGGDFRPQFRGIKYFSKEAFEGDALIFKKKYGVTIQSL